MTMLYQTTGVVLSRRDWREADRVYSVLTRVHGKREFVGRGARRALAKLSPHLETCAESDFLVVNGRFQETLAGVERRISFRGIYDDFTKTLLAHQGLRLVDIATRPRQSDPILYDETLRWLAFLDAAPAFSTERGAFLLASFAVKLLSILGYRPELLACLACHRPIEAGAFRWSALKGGVVCESCTKREPEEWFSVRDLTVPALKLLRFAASESFPDLLRIRLEGPDALAFHDAVESLMVSHFPTIPAVSLRGAIQV